MTNLAVDNFDKHIEDTMIAGDWISDRAAVEKVVRNAPEQIKELINWGVNFDKKEDGTFDLHKEGGHSEFRILHHKDNTGAEIQTSLIEAVKRHPNISIFTDARWTPSSPKSPSWLREVVRPFTATPPTRW